MVEPTLPWLIQQRDFAQASHPGVRIKDLRIPNLHRVRDLSRKQGEDAGCHRGSCPADSETIRQQVVQRNRLRSWVHLVRRSIRVAQYHPVCQFWKPDIYRIIETKSTFFD